MSEYKGGPDGPEGADDGYVDHGGIYTIDGLTIGDFTLTLDLETDEGEWETRLGAPLRNATPTEVALARRLHETEADYQRQIAALVKERDEWRGLVRGAL